MAVEDINKQYRAFVNAVDDSFTIAKMQDSFFPFVKGFLLDREEDFKKNSPLPAGVWPFLHTDKPLKKAEYSNIIASAFFDKKTFLTFLTGFPNTVQEIFKHLIWHGTLTEHGLKELFGLTLPRIEVKNGYNLQTYYAGQYRMFPLADHNDYYYSNEVSMEMYLPNDLRKLLLKHIGEPPKTELKTSIEEPVADFLFISGEHIFSDIPNCLNYLAADGVKHSTTEHILQGSINKARKFLKTAEFFPEKHKDWASVRTGMLLKLLEDAKQCDNHLETIKQIWGPSFLKSEGTIFDALMPHIKGWTFYAALERPQEKFLKAARQLPPGIWVNYSDFYSFSKKMYGDMVPISRGDALRYLKYKTEDGTITVSKVFYEPMIITPYLKGLLFLMAAFGLADLAYDDFNSKELDQTYFSPYDNLRAIRLTPLGAYILGLDSTYKAPVREQACVFADDKLEIRMLTEDAVKLHQLSVFAKQISSNRLIVDEHSFLMTCSDKKELFNKIDLFRKTAETALPKNWEDFFKGMIDKVKILSPIEEPFVFRLPPDDTLRRLVASDPVLKQKAIKAEGFMVIIEKKNYAPFKKRLKEFGYLIEP